MNETAIRKATIMKRTTTLTLLALLAPACLTAIPSIAQARYRDGMNLYEYVRSNPVRHVDPMGTTPIAIGDYGQSRPEIVAYHSKRRADARRQIAAGANRASLFDLVPDWVLKIPDILARGYGAHYAITKTYRDKTGAKKYYNFTPLKTIVSDKGGNLSVLSPILASKKPDIFNQNTLDLYEIKPTHWSWLAGSIATTEVLALRATGVCAKLGRMGAPGTQGSYTSPKLGVMYTWRSAAPGIITYETTDLTLRPVPHPKPAPEPTPIIRIPIPRRITYPYPLIPEPIPVNDPVRTPHFEPWHGPSPMISPEEAAILGIGLKLGKTGVDLILQGGATSVPVGAGAAGAAGGFTMPAIMPWFLLPGADMDTPGLFDNNTKS